MSNRFKDLSSHSSTQQKSCYQSCFYEVKVLVSRTAKRIHRSIDLASLLEVIVLSMFSALKFVVKWAQTLDF